MARTTRVTGAVTRTVPRATDKYIPELDGIRGVAISFVVLAHYGLGFIVPGGFGVTLFFFLSGYLITTLFYSEQALTGRINIPQFYLRRWLRLTPPLAIFIILGVAFPSFSRNFVGGQPVPLGTSVAALFYYTNYYDLFWGLRPDKSIPFEICWSLAVEEHFYLLWPWVVRKTLLRPTTLCVLIVALCITVFCWRVVGWQSKLLTGDYIYLASDCRIDSILYGALLRVLLETSQAKAVVKILCAPLSRVVAIIIILLTFLVRDEAFRQTIRYSLQGCAFIPLFLSLLTDDKHSLAKRLLSSKPTVLLGRLSYSIYLLHLLARTPGEVYFGSALAAGSIVSGLVITGGLAYGMFFFVERPIGRLRHRLRKEVLSGYAIPNYDPSRGDGEFVSDQLSSAPIELDVRSHPHLTDNRQP